MVPPTPRPAAPSAEAAPPAPVRRRGRAVPAPVLLDLSAQLTPLTSLLQDFWVEMTQRLDRQDRHIAHIMDGQQRIGRVLHARYPDDPDLPLPDYHSPPEDGS